MAESGLDQLKAEAEKGSEELPPIENVHAPQAAPAQDSLPMDTNMPDATSYLNPAAAGEPQSTSIAPATTSASTPRTSTPSRAVNGAADAPSPLPAKAASHGAPARRYLNEKVTSVLLEGMKRLAVEQPEMPLRALGEYLLQRSAEVEGRPS